MSYPFTIQDFRAGQRVQLHPGTDRWMRGDRFGTITAVGRKLLAVKLDRSGHTVRLAPRAIGELVGD